VRAQSLGAVICSSLAGLVIAAAPALAESSGALAVTGGVSGEPVNVSAGGGSSSSSSAPTKHAPVTAKTSNIAYGGPVYVKTASGELVPYSSSSSSEASHTVSGGSAVGVSAASSKPESGRPDLLVPGTLARYVDGLAAAPMSAPAAIQEIIWAGNQLIGLPYIYGGGHASFNSPGYDCSGTVSYALHGGDLLSSPEDSTEFEGYGSHGVGRWVTIFANEGHAYMTVAGLRLDTSPANDPSDLPGPRWRPLRPANEGFVVRHPTGL
jgi:cell wall-associated NlpC family hydrolase